METIKPGGTTIENNRFSGNARGAITFNTDSFSGENSIIGNTFTGGDEPPTAIDGFTTDDSNQ